MDFGVWLSGVGRRSCEECQDFYARGNRQTRWDRSPPKQKQPPCSTCRPQGTHPYNVEVLALYNRCGSQWIYHPITGLPTELRLEAIESSMNMRGVDISDRPFLLDQILMLARKIASEIAKDAEEQKEKRENKR